MKNSELELLLTDEIKKIKKQYRYYGLRFEKKERNVGEIITECSKHNPQREDERDFPKYNSNEYISLPTLKGVSAWKITKTDEWKDSFMSDWDKNMDFFTADDEQYAYIIAGNNVSTHKDHDPNEIVLVRPIVISKIKIYG